METIIGPHPFINDMANILLVIRHTEVAAAITF
jgi:hypothetical protein